MNEKDKELVFKILRSTYYSSLYEYVSKHKHFMQKDLKKALDIKYHSHISTTIKFFRDNGLIECKNEKDVNYKFYNSTLKFDKLKEEVEKYTKTN